LALAEVTSYLHFIAETGIVSHDAQVKRKLIDRVFITSCIVTNIVRNALWVTQIENPTYWYTAWISQIVFFVMEGMTLLYIGWTEVLLHLLTTSQHQKKVYISLLGFRPAYYPIN